MSRPHRSIFFTVASKRKENPERKKLTVPRGTMTIAEMLRRYVRREALPMERQGIYVDAGHDLEKVSKMDAAEQQEILSDVRAGVARMRAELEAAQAAPAPAKKKVAKQKDPKGDGSVKNPPPKGA